MLATFFKPEGNYLKKVVNVPPRFTILINEIFNPKIVNLYQDKTDFTVSAEVTKKYKLEIVAEADGFKDYDETIIKQ